MRNNFDIIEELLNKEPFLLEDNMYVFVQIIARNKDGDLPFGNGIKKFYIFRTIDKFLQKKAEIIELCNLFNARAYINIVPGYYDNLLKNVQYQLSYAQLFNNDVNIIGVVASAAATSKLKHKYFMIDVDNNEDVEAIFDYFNKENIITHATLSTVGGTHIITDKFDRVKFSKMCRAEVKQDITTLLFAP